jgi:hypothetical protein
MAHLDQVTVAQDKGATVLDLPRLQEEGTWGMYHELGTFDKAWQSMARHAFYIGLMTTGKCHGWLTTVLSGHNQQESAWTFSGAGEVTVNLFTLYSMQRLHGIEPVLHPWILKQKAKAKAYLQDETSSSKEKWAQWKRDAGMALWMYAQLQHEYVAYRSITKVCRRLTCFNARFGWDLYHKVFVVRSIVYSTVCVKPTLAAHYPSITALSYSQSQAHR